MNGLDDAWTWYTSAKRALALTSRLAGKYWGDLPPDGKVWADDRFKGVSGDTLKDLAETGLRHLDDVAVAVLFSVFESVVRTHLVTRMKPDAGRVSDPILASAVADAIQGVEEGSFYRRVLAPLKDQRSLDPDLVTKVDQVRDYRNWVAHGRRGAPKNLIDPRTARDRLQEFLSAIGIPPADSQHV